MKYSHWWFLSIYVVNFIKIHDKKIFSKFSSFSSHFWCNFCALQNSFFDFIFGSIRLKLEIYSLMVPFYLYYEFHKNPWQKNFGQIFKFFKPFLVQFFYTSKFIFWPYFFIVPAVTWNIIIDGPFLSMLWIWSKSVTKNFLQIFKFFKPLLVQFLYTSKFIFNLIFGSIRLKL